MFYEVEQKYPAPDLTALEKRLRELGATVARPVGEVDLYFVHPVEDFAKTDEALRLRRKEEKNFITYKGPKIDATTKTRREIELPLPPGEETIGKWRELLEAVGFRPVAEVRKSRKKAKIVWQGRGVECSLDTVEGLGTYFELEVVTEESGLDAARAVIASLAEKLGLSGNERRSYLELLLRK
jgi:adenylate cyclase, class 2